MSRRGIGIGAFMILLIIGIVIVSRRPAAPSLSAPIESGSLPAKPKSAHAAAPAAPIKAPLGVWVRPLNGEGNPSQVQELLDAQALPAQEAEWIRTAIQERNAYNQGLVAACQAIDQKEVLAQQGCVYGGLSAQWMKSRTGLTSNRVSDNARTLAAQYWKSYGTQMMANIGCSS